MKVSPRVSLSRFVFGVSCVAGFAAAMAWIGRTQPPWAAAIAAVLFTVPLCSLGEWLVHGILYHNRLPGLAFIRDIHHKGHHFALFPPRNYVQEEGYPFMKLRKGDEPWQMADSAKDNFVTKWSQIALHFATGIPLILVPSWFITHSVAFVVSAFATLSFISWMLAYVHGVIHTPGNRWVERQWWFCWLDRHHYIHHVDITANMNFMMPLCDLLFGTMKAELLPREVERYPSFEQAKPMAKDIPVIAEDSIPTLETSGAFRTLS